MISALQNYEAEKPEQCTLMLRSYARK
jgi:hypothetical protein